MRPMEESNTGDHSPPGPIEYVLTVPDHYDRIVWRGRYYHLPLSDVKDKLVCNDKILAEAPNSEQLESEFPAVTGPDSAIDTPIGQLELMYSQARRHAKDTHDKLYRAMLDLLACMDNATAWREALVKVKGRI